MSENVLIAILGGGNLLLFVKFLIERVDKKKERAEDKKAENEAKELEGIKSELTLLKKDGIRTQLLILILMQADEQTEILKVAEHYFVDLEGNWYMTSLFKNWCEKRGLEPDWFDKE